MTATVNTHEAKTQLSKLLHRVEQGEEIIIARDGKPVARLIPERTHWREVRFGTARGLVTYAEDWNAPMTQSELAEWFDAPPTAEPIDETPPQQ